MSKKTEVDKLAEKNLREHARLSMQRPEKSPERMLTDIAWIAREGPGISPKKNALKPDRTLADAEKRDQEKKDEAGNPFRGGQ